MFSLIRTFILVMIAFVAGVLFERSNTGELCVAAGGRMAAGLCRGAS
jgi:hypothetical protein